MQSIAPQRDAHTASTYAAPSKSARNSKAPQDPATRLLPQTTIQTHWPVYGGTLLPDVDRSNGALPPPPQTRLAHERFACGNMFFMYGFVFGSFHSQLPTTKERLGIGDVPFAGLLLADDVGNIAALTATRYRPDVLRRRGVAPGCGALVAMAAGAASIAREPSLFAAAMLTFGSTSSLFDVACNLTMVELEQQSGAPQTSFFHGLFSAGQLIGSGAGAAMTWARLPFAPRIGAVATGLAALYLANIPWLGARLPQHEALPPVQRSAPRGLAGLIVLGALSSLAEGAASEWPGIYLREVLGADASIANASSLAYGAGMTTSRLLGGRAAAHWGTRPVLVAGGAITAAAMAAGLVNNRPWSLLCAVAAVGAGLANNTPLTISAAGRLQGDSAAHVATLSIAQQLGFFAGPPLIGVVSGITTLRCALASVAVVGVLVAICGLSVGTAQDAAPPAMFGPAGEDSLPPIDAGAPEQV